MIRRALALAIGLGAVVAFPVACSLGLDESLIGREADASTEAGGPDASVDSGTDGGTLFEIPDGGKCREDKECKANNPCLQGRCELGRQVCVYDVCKQPVCLSGTCNVQAKACSTPPIQYKFRAFAFQVTQGGVGCGGSPTRCFAAVHPFVFVGTTNGVVAFSATDPSNPSPTPVPITGLPFFPTAMVASGTRVYFLGSVLGSAPNLRLQLAWVDVPVDPFAATIPARSVLANYTKGSADVLVAGAEGQALLVNTSIPSFPSAILSAPLVEPVKVDPLTLAGFSISQAPVAASGNRIVMHQFVNNTATFSLETGVGTPTSTNGGDQPLTSFGPLAMNQQAFGQGPDGSLLWAVAAAVPTDAGPPTFIKSAKLVWLLADQAATKFETTTAVDVETYPAATSLGQQVTGPVAWVNKDSALVAVAASQNLAQTTVRLVAKSGVVADKNFGVAVSVDRVGVASSAGYGYVLTADSATQATINVVAPDCAP
ncbi:MAG: hypothetical protein JNL38_12375 [Myxococcales bacterium]|nr:hypothetical protein [Myxococcales bacterium]